jgi:hypothetical protein
MNKPPASSHSSPILCFPSHVTVLFALIVLVSFATLIAGLNGALRIFALLLLILAVLLPLRDLLRWVDDTRTRYATTPDPVLQPIVDTLSAELGISPSPRIECTAHPVGLFMVGALRRSLIVGNTVAFEFLHNNLDPGDENPGATHIILYHEMQHIVQHDVRRLGWTRQLLIVLLKWSTWTLLMISGLLLFLRLFTVPVLEILATPDFMASFLKSSNTPGMAPLLRSLLPPAGEIQQMLARAHNIDFGRWMLATIIALMPLACATGLLWITVWHRMMEVREFYADAACVERFGQGRVQAALCDFSVWCSVRTSNQITSQATPSINNVFDQLAAGIHMSRARLLPRALAAHFGFHPVLKRRIKALKDPIAQVIAPAHNGVVIGTVVLLLNILLAGGFSLLVVGEWPIYLSALTAFTTIAVLMLPAAVAQPFALTWHMTLKCALIVIAIGFCWPFVNAALTLIMLMTTPEFLLRLLESTVGGLMGISESFANLSQLSGIATSAWGMLVASISAALLIPAMLYLDLRIKRRVVTWARSPRPYLAVIFTMGCGLTWLLLLVTALLVAEPQRLTNTWGLLLIMATGAASGTLWLCCEKRHTTQTIRSGRYR